MIYIIGDNKHDVKEFLSGRTIPYFKYEEDLFDRGYMICLHNSHSDNVTLVIDTLGLFTLQVYDCETGGLESETLYTNYNEAIAAYLAQMEEVGNES